MRVNLFLELTYLQIQWDTHCSGNKRDFRRLNGKSVDSVLISGYWVPSIFLRSASISPPILPIHFIKKFEWVIIFVCCLQTFVNVDIQSRVKGPSFAVRASPTHTIRVLCQATDANYTMDYQDGKFLLRPPNRAARTCAGAGAPLPPPPPLPVMRARACVTSPPPAPAPATLPVAGQSCSWKDPCRHRRGQGRPSLRYRQWRGRCSHKQKR